MTVAEIALWTSLFAIAYTYALYPCILFAAYALAQMQSDLRYLTARRERRCRRLSAEVLPPVSFVIPVFNEAPHLKAKLENLRALDYPKDKLQVIFVCDGSTDGSDDILLKFDDANVRVVCLANHRGKAHALNVGVRYAAFDIVVFSDAATLFTNDAVEQLVRHFVDPRVGVVCGALNFRGGAEYRSTEGAYWQYEKMLRLMEGRLGATLTASGAIYALRRACYQPLTADQLIDDFIIPMHARRLGFRVVYDPEAQAMEVLAGGIGDEFGRRMRLAVGSFRAMKDLLTVPMGWWTLFAFVSHKVMRWVLPLFFISGFVSNVFVAREFSYGRWLLLGQITFYVWALCGFVLTAQLRRVRYGLFPYFVVAMHTAFLIGFVRIVTGRGQVAWRSGR